MTIVLMQASYTGKAWNALIKDPQNRLEAVRPTIKSFGGEIVKAYLAFGDFDVVAILRLPDNVSAAALSMSLKAGGAIEKVKTSILMKWEDGIKAMKKAQESTYQPPKTSPMLDRQ